MKMVNMEKQIIVKIIATSHTWTVADYHNEYLKTFPICKDIKKMVITFMKENNMIPCDETRRDFSWINGIF